MALGVVHRRFMFLHGVTLSLVQSFVFARLRRLFQSVSARLWCQLAAALPSRIFTTLPNLMSVRSVMKMHFMPFSRLWMKTFTTVSDPENRIQNHLPAKPWAWHCNQFSTLSSRLLSPSLPTRVPKEPAKDRLLFPQVQSLLFRWRRWSSFPWSAGALCSESLLCSSCVWKCSVWGLGPYSPACSSPKPVPCLPWVVVEGFISGSPENQLARDWFSQGENFGD